MVPQTKPVCEDFVADFALSLGHRLLKNLFFVALLIFVTYVYLRLPTLVTYVGFFVTYGHLRW